MQTSHFNLSTKSFRSHQDTASNFPNSPTKRPKSNLLHFPERRKKICPKSWRTNYDPPSWNKKFKTIWNDPILASETFFVSGPSKFLQQLYLRIFFPVSVKKIGSRHFSFRPKVADRPKKPDFFVSGRQRFTRCRDLTILICPPYLVKPINRGLLIPKRAQLAPLKNIIMSVRLNNYACTTGIVFMTLKWGFRTGKKEPRFEWSTIRVF